MISRGVLLVGVLFAAPVHAAADPVESAAPAPCVVKGTLVQSATIYDLAKGGQPIADLIGTVRWVEVSEFQPRAQRLRVVSGKSTPNLRVEGYVDAGAMPIGATSDVSVAGSVLSIRATVPLRVQQLNGSIVVEPRSSPFDGVEASVACSDLHVVAEKSAPRLPPSGSSLVPIVKGLDLFGSPGGTPLLTLRVVASPSSVTINGYETVNGYVHVRYAADVLIDGWMRRSDLSEQSLGGIGGCIGIGGLGAWGTSAASSYAQRDTEVRLGDQGARVGVLEKGARVVRWGTGAGAWTQIRIYDADAHEPTGKAFFVQEADLGASPP